MHYKGAKKPQEIELAYIIRGQRGIIKRMNDLIKSARKEITMLISYPSIMESVKTSLDNAKERKVKLNLAVTKEVLNKVNIAEFSQVKLLHCPYTILIVDMKTLLTVSSWAEENSRAILTQDLGLVTVSKEYYRNPQCCTRIG